MDTLRQLALEEGVILAQPEPLAPAVHRHGSCPVSIFQKSWPWPWGKSTRAGAAATGWVRIRNRCSRNWDWPTNNF